MKHLPLNEWKERSKQHEKLVSKIPNSFLANRSVHKKHPVYDFLFTYYTFSPTKLKQWTPSIEESLEVNDKIPTYFTPYWFEVKNNTLQLNRNRLRDETFKLASFVKNLCQTIIERPPRFGCFGLHEWAMVYKQSQGELRHELKLRLTEEELASFVEKQTLCCTHYDAYRFFTPQALPLNLFQPTLETRLQNEQAGCVHANMDLYKWGASLWPWIGADFIGKAFLLTVEGRELDMRASPYDLKEYGFDPICIETEKGRKEYQELQLNYSKKVAPLRQQLHDFCKYLVGLEKVRVP